jgi:hypothetical protein
LPTKLALLTHIKLTPHKSRMRKKYKLHGEQNNNNNKSKRNQLHKMEDPLLDLPRIKKRRRNQLK